MKPTPPRKYEEEARTIYVTKYALSRGILVCKAQIGLDGRAWIGSRAYFGDTKSTFSFYGGMADTQYALTLEAAQLQVTKLRERKIISLLRQAKKLSEQKDITVFEQIKEKE